MDIVEIFNDTRQQDMKAKTIEEAKELAKAKSLEKKHKEETVHIIYCNRTEYFYIDTDGLIRLWEQSFGYYVNVVYTAEKSN
ncbi:DNA-binding protein [Chryseobacterium mucoviscidosis]|uniref:DNA-binding protein n=1 Tax=Chryseobacterium mucoviscidosis TaxID=1945581 RepID=UPI001E58D52A|nr:DNA-binding protein [Chryseobacterium mucoviscidosis]